MSKPYGMASTSITPVPVGRDYDLTDGESDLQKWPQLRNVLEILRETLLPVYLSADAAAGRQQRRHGWLVSCAAVFGTLAVLCAILELSEFIADDQHRIGLVELGAGAAAVIAVVLGIWASFHLDWIAKRFVAEQCRFVKFHILLNPSLWYGRSAQEVRRAVERLLQPIQKSSPHLAHDWVRWKREIVGRFDDVPDGFPDDVARELMDYCVAKRLDEQHSYFDRETRKRGRWEFITKHVSPWCFFLSIVAAFLHFAFQRIAGADVHSGWAAWSARVSMLLAAALPAIAAGVRTFRSAHEFGRNQLRFDAMSDYLATARVNVGKQTSPQSKLHLLREAEAALDAEHRAWLFLTFEAEWFG